ncbi:MAG: 3-deoxy-D-manno-octulosonic acid transferase [Acidiferrobacteraceae bacterium]
MSDWFRWGRPGLTDRDRTGATVLLRDVTTAVPPGFLAALDSLFDPLAIVRLGPGGEVPADPGAAVRLLRRLKPRHIVVVGRLPCRADFLCKVKAPVSWISAEQEDAGRVDARVITVRGRSQQGQLPGALVTGDPLLGIDGLPNLPDDMLCERFRPMHERGRWVLYFADTEADEEVAAYATFLKLSRRGVGLLVLAPRDPARYEPVYRDAMRFHLMTNRHARLLTSFVPPQTRVYYLEDPAVGRGMYRCADVVVAGGTLATEGPDPDVILPLALARPVVAGPLGLAPVLAAARADGAVRAVGGLDDLEPALMPLLTLAEERKRQGDAGKAWLEAQVGAAQRVLALLR